jgi:Ca2+-binding EF-hand superfamily protein
MALVRALHLVVVVVCVLCLQVMKLGLNVHGEELNELFDSFDHDNNGRLTSKELVRVPKSDTASVPKRDTMLL